MQANKSSTHSVTSAKKFSLTAPMVLRILLGIVILTVAGQVEIPFFPVPMTLQTLAVFGIAMCFRKGEGWLGQCDFICGDWYCRCANICPFRRWCGRIVWYQRGAISLVLC